VAMAIGEAGRDRRPLEVMDHRLDRGERACQVRGARLD
jgi:hypothetical protein